jgi:hypothetical protein
VNNSVQFETSLAFGQEVERACADILRSKNMVTEPDICIYDNARDVHFFVECKRKTAWVSWCGKKETGLDIVCHDRLLRLHNSSGLDVWLIFYHEKQSPTGWFSLKLGTVEPRRWDGNKPNGEPVRGIDGRPQKPLALWTLETFSEMKDWKLL